MMTETQFPLPPGSEVSLKCSPGHTLTGDSTVTCVQGTDFSFVNTPFCELGTMVNTPNYLNFNYILKKNVRMFVILEVHLLHYQLLSTDECNKLPETQNLGTTAQFPVSYNAPVKVQCDTGYSLIGDHIITCIRGDSFRSFHDQLPTCNASEWYIY